MTATGVELIAAERERQIDQLGYTAAHDLEHDDSDLAFAACCYAAPVTIHLLKIDQDTDEARGAGAVHWVEPWPQGWDRTRRDYPTSKEVRIRELSKAGALIAAEIDRLQAQEDSMVDIDSLPLLVKIVWACAAAWHFAYLFALVGSTFELALGYRKQFKRWDFDVAAAEEKMKNAPPEKLGEATKEWLETLTAKHKEPDRRLMEEIRRELWWVEVHIAFPMLNLMWAVTANSTWDFILTALNVVLNWFWWKYHDHDDRWKKRRKKAASKVKEVAGRLVVVPVPAPSPS